ncbi:USP6 N-terminal-like protein isoform X1 [Carcharodon carcharias]|uniref:USP6 N-terminal-like protein isoform X1 n=2 Tax=Carcharodon carcharias TaxID=13397 RepID=UPI001B7E4680|nr:USP6 N-terminal-like protein isoform X1 [Carcharodon carcharias]XP_041059313.1 USP6 N-terminal-like protein isoform X1 [Carcharodon carcharias]XP_041059314.1 USP6 N-terminal-like protein isoform X1 [Carcharodon carcharias]
MNPDAEQDAAVKLAEERAEIVSKYDKGREGAKIDPWEDADFHIYKITDRFGFLHAKELPMPDAVEERLKQIEIERTGKWLKMLKSWDKYKNGEKVIRRIYKGIPLQLRGEVWSLLLEIQKIKLEKKDLYDKLKSRARTISPDIRQIDLDVNRTYRDHIMFRERYGVKQQALFHVLAAYSMYNTEVGYCQGMSQITALLLMYLNEEDAFWALVRLLSDTKHSMHGFFVPGFPKLLRFQEHHDRILKKFMPKLKQHLDSQDVFTTLYTMKWFFQCFLDRTPFTLTLRLWDIYMLEGDRILTAMSYTILKLHKKHLMKLSMEDLIEFLQESLAKDFYFDDDFVIDQLQNSMSELKRNKLDLPPAGKPEEFPQKSLGQVSVEHQEPPVRNHMINGQNNTAKVGPSASRKKDRKTSPEKLLEKQPDNRHGKSTLEKPTSKSHRVESLENQGGRVKVLPDLDVKKQHGLPPQHALAYGNPKQLNNATANQNSNANPTVKKDFTPKWNKPSGLKISEATSKHSMDGKGRTGSYNAPSSPSSPEETFVGRAKALIIEVGETKRDSNASQYDNVPGVDHEYENRAEEMAEDREHGVTQNNALARETTLKNTSPSKLLPAPLSSNVSANSQARPPRTHSGSVSSNQRPLIKRQPSLPPSYTSPPGYHGSLPQYSPTRSKDMPQYSYNLPGGRTNHDNRPYGTKQAHLPDYQENRMNYTITRQFSNSSQAFRTAAQPLDHSGQYDSVNTTNYIRHPAPYEGTQLHSPEYQQHYTRRQEQYEQHWNQETDIRYRRNMQGSPSFRNAQHTPVPEFSYQSVASPGSNIYNRTLPYPDPHAQTRYPNTPFGPQYYGKPQTDRRAIPESVLL